MVGSIIIRTAFAAALLATLLYYLVHRKRSSVLLKYARLAYRTAVAGMVSAAGLLIYLIMTHQFHYAYVWNYSSTDLPGPLLFSTFYAGQEGSFSLWAFYTSIVGLVLMWYSSKKGYEAELMLIYSAILSFLLLMIIVKNPFAYIWDLFPKDLIHSGPIPAGVTNFVWLDQAKGLWAQYPSEGKGLNPLLQNYWMVIHPQVLFIGFTSMSVPFAYAVAGMLRRDYVSWIRVSTPWTVFGAMILGTGIVMGGFWAYETLGWGGYWGWDPVENSSLIPWLVCVASIHTMLSQRRSGSFIKTNFILSIFCFMMVLYSTFLTRSGVLGDTSVHSFVEPGMLVYWLLLAGLFLFASIGFGLFFSRMKEMPKVPVGHSFLSREFALFLGSSAIVFAALFIVIGTSSPIITGILKGKVSAVDSSYYVTTTLPLGICIAILAGVGQLLWWKNSDTESLMKSLRIPVGLALLFTLGSFIAGAHQVAMLIFLCASSFALFTNSIVGYRIFRGNPKMAGGSIAHIGLSLMFLGFVASAKYDNKETISLEEGKQVQAMGYTMRYLGYHPIERGRFAFDVEVERGGEKFIVAPVMFNNKESEGLMRNPDIINLMTKDFYVSPLSLEAPDSKNEQDLTIEKDEVQQFDGMSIQYTGYSFATSPEKGNVVTVNLEVTKGGKTEHLTPEMQNQRGKVIYVPATLENSDVSFTIKGMGLGNGGRGKSSVTVTVATPLAAGQQQKAETLIVEASIKPFINLVWIGTITLVAGFLITIVRRAGEARRNAQG
ncbi:MAG TPA: cytochrome c biogenesis protein CcsA [Bacteroidota bacterium]|nr:cytochrome c biogenesis protein CcsA [Bacteroidota bacterium]